MDIERALAVASVAHAIINSAKLELRFLELKAPGSKSEFLSNPTPAPPLALATTVPSNGNGQDDKRVQCNQCPERVLPAQLGEHKRAKHSLLEKAESA